MSTEQKLHLVAITFLGMGVVLAAVCMFTGVWNGLWVLAILALATWAVVEAWAAVHYGREAWTAAHEDDEP